MRTFYTRQGGKNLLKKRLLEIFPPIDTYNIYVEPFFGAGNLFFLKPKSPKEIINDKEKMIYYALKDIQKVGIDDIDRMDWTCSKRKFITLKNSKPTTHLQRLYKFLYLNWNSFAGMMKSYSENGCLRRNIDRFKLQLQKLKDRLKGVIILNQDYTNVIKKYDTPFTFFYLDPPYYDVNVSGYYEHGTIDVKELAFLLKNLKGKFMLSYNDNSYIRREFQDFRIRKIETVYIIGGIHRPIEELIITNY
jgi:DNA adenine methylase